MTHCKSLVCLEPEILLPLFFAFQVLDTFPMKEFEIIGNLQVPVFMLEARDVQLCKD